jgi:uncharacterized delta-60 repeat protein
MTRAFRRTRRESCFPRRRAVVVAAAVGIGLIAATAAFAGSAGDRDRSFGHDGIAVVPRFDVSASSGAVGASNRIVAVGGHGVFKVTRTLPDGHIDPDFGNRGLVTVRFGSDEASPSSVAITRFGGIIVAGTVCSDFRTCNFGVARLHANGDLNPNFGDGGTTEIDFPEPYIRNTSMALGSGGRIVLAGSNARYNAHEWDIALAALRSNGSLDPRFGHGGKTVSSFAPPGDYCPRAGLITAMALDSRDRIVVDGECMGNGRPGVARFKSSGRLDSSFSGNGVVNRDLGILRTEALTVDKRNRVDVMGSTGHFWVVSRLRTDGGLDRSFGKKGRGKASWSRPSDTAIHVRSGAVDSRGRIIVGGSHSSGFAFVRFKPNGHLNRRFGRRGHVVVKDPSRNFHLDLTGAVAVAKRDRIIGVGAQRRIHHSGTHLALVRLLG